VIVHSVKAPHKKGGILKAFAARGDTPSPDKTKGRKILNAVEGIEDRMLMRRINQTFVSVKARKMSALVKAGSLSFKAAVDDVGPFSNGWEVRWRIGIRLLAPLLGVYSGEVSVSESSSPEEETAVYSGAEELSDALSAAIRCSAKARSSVVSHQAVPGPVGSHSKVMMAMTTVRIPSEMKRTW
jgi:hypothetical protein